MEQSNLVESANNLEIGRLEAEEKMYNPVTTRIAEIHVNEELQRAERIQQAEAACKPQSGWNQRMGLALSEILIAAGEKLRQRYEPEACYETLKA